jgi:hypothetical protein
VDVAPAGVRVACEDVTAAACLIAVGGSTTLWEFYDEINLFCVPIFPKSSFISYMNFF